jgi:hypothetical protein
MAACHESIEIAPGGESMTYRTLWRALAGVTLGAAALISFPASAISQPVDEVGYLAECSGEADGYAASVNLFQTSAQGGFVEASGFIETPDGSTLLVTGFTDGDLIFDDDGTIDIVLTLVNEETQEPAGSAPVSGTYTVTGRPTRVHEVINEGEEIVISVGTHTPLSVDLTFEYANTTIALECENAFAFDLMVIRNRIGTPG